MSRHTSKQNSLSMQISKKPYDCVYEKKGIRNAPREQVLVDKFKVDIVNHLVNEMLSTDQTLETALAVSRVFTYLEIRKESSQAATCKDSSNF